MSSPAQQPKLAQYAALLTRIDPHVPESLILESVALTRRYNSIKFTLDRFDKEQDKLWDDYEEEDAFKLCQKFTKEFGASVDVQHRRIVTLLNGLTSHYLGRINALQEALADSHAAALIASAPPAKRRRVASVPDALSLPLTPSSPLRDIASANRELDLEKDKSK